VLIPLLNPRDALRPTAIALGSFDGLHAGHRRVIAAVTGTESATPRQDGTAAGWVQVDAGHAAAGLDGPQRAEPPSAEPAAPAPQATTATAATAALLQPVQPGETRPEGADLVATVVSFWPHPREVLHGEMRLRLDLPSEKLELLEPLGIRQLVLVPFDQALAALSPEDFVEQVLVGQLQARQVAVGCNFRFGAQRRGDGDTLVKLGARHGIEVTVVPVLEVEGERMSSSRIRQALAAGEIAAATRLLLRPYRFSGRVVRGRGLGRQLGWPTANLRVDGRKFLPLEGVYAAWVWLHPPAAAGVPSSWGDPGGMGSAAMESTAVRSGAERWQPGLESSGGPLPIGAAAGGAPALALPAVMNLGPQPTIDPLSPSAVEVHLLEGSPQLEDAWLTVEPVRLLRRQQRFAGLAELSQRIGLDAEQARQLLQHTGPAGPPPA
jgi:riboflavin kinase / FMN adenylyltransferase